MKKIILSFALFILCKIILTAQIIEAEYILDFNNSTNEYEVSMHLVAGDISSELFGVLVGSQVSIVTPVGENIRLRSMYNPVIAHPVTQVITPATWLLNNSVSSPASQPQNKFQGITVQLSPSSHFNDMSEGDVVKLFSFDFGDNTVFSNLVRLFINGVDPDYTATGMYGGDFSNYFNIGGENNPDPVEPFRIKLRLYLGGAVVYNGDEIGSTHTRPLMRDNLRMSPYTSQNYIPLSDPYQFEQGNHSIVTDGKYKHYNCGTLDQFSTIIDADALLSIEGEDAIVDWVFVELRSASDSTIIVATRSGLVQRDGDVVDVDGELGLWFKDIPEENYFVVVRHRNHFGTMTSTPKSVVELKTLIDFTLSSTGIFDFGEIAAYDSPELLIDYTGYGQNPNNLTDYLCLWAGDLDGNGVIGEFYNEDDLDIILNDVLMYDNVQNQGSPNTRLNFNKAFGYAPGDMDMDSRSKYINPNDDKNYLSYAIRSYPNNLEGNNSYKYALQQVPIIDTIPPVSLKVKLRVYLSGGVHHPIASGTTHSRPLMHDGLRESTFTGERYIPNVDPYQYEQPNHTIVGDGKYVHYGPGGLPEYSRIVNPEEMFAIEGEDAIVDWVFVELRSNNNNSEVIATRSGLVQRDGDVVDVDNSLGLSFTGVPSDDYYVVVRHRSHLGAMTANPQTTAQLNTLVDFTKSQTGIFDFGLTDISPTGVGFLDYSGLGENSMPLAGYLCLWMGDANQDGRTSFIGPQNDVKIIGGNVLGYPLGNGTYNNKGNFDWAFGYAPGDLTMDGKTKFANPYDDQNHLFFTVLVYPSNTAFLTNFGLLLEQVPK